jgi:hypothetical protein
MPGAQAYGNLGAMSKKYSSEDLMAAIIDLSEALEYKMNKRFDSVETRFDAFERRLHIVERRLA